MYEGVKIGQKVAIQIYATPCPIRCMLIQVVARHFFPIRHRIFRFLLHEQAKFLLVWENNSKNPLE